MESSAVSDKEILIGFITGSDSGFEELSSRYESRLFNFAFNMTGSYLQAEDVVFNVLFRVYREAERIVELDNPQTEFFKFTIEAIEHISESASYDPEIEGCIIDIPSRYALPLEHRFNQVIDFIDRDLFSEAIRKLPDAYKMVYLLRDAFGFSCSEVAEITSTPIQKVKMLLNRSRLMLRNMLHASEHVQEETLILADDFHLESDKLI